MRISSASSVARATRVNGPERGRWTDGGNLAVHQSTLFWRCLHGGDMSPKLTAGHSFISRSCITLRRMKTHARTRQFACLYVCVSVCFYVSLSTCQSVCVSVSLSVCLRVSLGWLEKKPRSDIYKNEKRYLQSRQSVIVACVHRLRLTESLPQVCYLTARYLLSSFNDMAYLICSGHALLCTFRHDNRIYAFGCRRTTLCIISIWL